MCPLVRLCQFFAFFSGSCGRPRKLDRRRQQGEIKRPKQTVKALRRFSTGPQHIDAMLSRFFFHWEHVKSGFR